MWWESQPSLCSQPTHGVHSTCVHTGDPDEFKPEYMSPALAGLVGDVVYGSPAL
jgi:hypothetical protein